MKTGHTTDDGRMTNGPTLASTVHPLSLLFLLLSERTPLKRCCVHNMSPFISSSGLSPGSREAKVQRAKVCLNCMEPSVARSSYWLLPVRRYLLDSRCKGSLVVLTRWESGEQPVVPLTSAFDTWRVYGILKIVHSAHMSNACCVDSFYRATRMHSTDYAVARCLSVHLSVCPSVTRLYWV